MRIAAMDLGSNSFHLLVADARPDGTFEPLARDKEMLRLGSLVASTGAIGSKAAVAAIDVVKRFKAAAESLAVSEIVVCATAAVREAVDSAGIVDRIEEETGLAVRVISGQEEARLIFEAVRASVAIEPAPTLALDLGGGSLELMIGDQARLVWSASLKLGVGRLTAELVRSDPPGPADRRRLAHAVTVALGRVLPDVAAHRPVTAIASSGTLTTLIKLAAARRGGPIPATVNQLTVRGSELVELGDVLFGLTASERADLPGVDARRNDLLPAGIVVLTTLLELTGIRDVTGCDWALREGMVLDAIGRHAQNGWGGDPAAMRRASVVGLCRRCSWSEPHSRKVARLATALFDGTRAWHHMDDLDRELLDLGALLHDIGEHVSVDDHDAHSAYLIEHGRLRGFAPEEIDVLACLGRFHRRGTPKPSFEPFVRLPAERRDRTARLIAMLQVADGLDRSHGGPVTGIAVYAETPGLVEVVVEATGDIDLELWGLRRKKAFFERVFDCRLEVVSGQLELALDPPGPAVVGA